MAARNSFWSAVAAVALFGCGEAALPPAGSALPVEAGTGASARARFVSPYSYEWFVRAELARSRGEWANAAQAYERVLAGDTDDPYVLAQLARTQVELGAPDDAEATLALALRVDPASENAWLARAWLAEQRGEVEEALVLYQDAARVAPDSMLPWIELSRLLRAQGHEQRELALWRERTARGQPATGASIARELEAALSQGRPEQIAFALQRLVREHGAPADAVRRGARALLEAGRAELAVPVLDALPAGPDDAALRLQVLLNAGEHAAAEQLLAIESPQALGGTLAVAEAYLRIGRPAQARERLAEAPELPGDWRRQRLAGAVALELAECAEAAQLLAGIPPASAQSADARADLKRALDCAGLPGLAAELGDGG